MEHRGGQQDGGSPGISHRDPLRQEAPPGAREDHPAPSSAITWIMRLGGPFLPSPLSGLRTNPSLPAPAFPVAACGAETKRSARGLTSNGYRHIGSLYRPSI